MNESSNETVALENMTSQEKNEWRLTGVEPVREVEETKPAKEEAKVVEITKKPADEEAEVVAADREEDAESGTATKTEEQTGKAKKPTQMGYRDLRSRIAELEAQIAKGAKPVAADNEAKAKDDKKDEHPRPKSSDKKADGSPKYATWEEYEDDLLEWRAEKDRATSKQEAAKAQLTTEREKLEKESQSHLRSRADEARKKYPDFDAKALDPTLKIPQGSVLATWVMDPGNEQGMEIAYYFGTHREELDKFNTLTPFQQARELTRLEDKLSQSTPAVTEKKSDITVVTAPTKVTKAPPPAKEVGGRGSASGNEEDGLVGAGDFRAYKRVVDKKEIATRK